MKNKLFLTALGLLVFTCLNAATVPDPTTNTEESCVKGKKNDITGVVSNSDNKKPINDVSVTAYLISKKEKTIQTDETGIYAFDGLKPGTYKFVFEKSGYKKVTKEKVVIKTDESFQLDIEMIESRDFDLIPSPLHFTDF